jgi:pSer/pThr/pTyr-binding forkhead associated (FHA) protein
MINNKTVESHIERLVLGAIPRLIAIDGPLIGQTIYLDEPVVSIGRQLSNDIILNDPHVSRNHCVIRTKGEHYMIEDLNSANGTYVNSKLVEASTLKEGSLIKIGASWFLFRLQDPEEEIALSQNLVEAENASSPFEEIRLG